MNRADFVHLSGHLGSPEGVRSIEVSLHVRHCIFTLSVTLRSALFLGNLSELKCEKK